MLSSLIFILSLTIDLLYLAIPIISYLFIIKNNNVRYISNNVALTLIFTDLTTPVGLIIGQSGQNLTIILIIVLSANIIKSMFENKFLNIDVRKLSIFLLVTVFMLILPSLFFFINSPEMLIEYEFWAKRIILILILMTIGFFKSVYTLNSILSLVQLVYLINCSGVILSYLVPEIFLLFINTEDPMLTAGLNPMGGGFFLNPNGAALSVIFSYLALIYLKIYIKGFKLIYYSILFLFTLALGGSRSGFLCGALILLMINKDIIMAVRNNINMKNLSTILCLIIASLIILLNVTEVGSISGFSRIINIKNEGNLESNDLRWNALIKGMELVTYSPLTGSGFGLRAKLLDLQPHNTFVAYAIDVGIIGLLVFPIFIVYLMRRVFYLQDKLYFRITVFSILFMGLFDHEVINSKPFGYLLFISIALSQFLPKLKMKS